MSRCIDFYLIGELVDSHGNVHYEDLKNLPTAEVVEVVRCKDCKWFNQIVCKRMNRVMKSDGFCSNGERREDDKGTSERNP